MTSSVIAAQGADNSLMFYWQTNGTAPWHAEQVAGPGTTFSAPSIAQVGDSSAIAAQGRDGSLMFYWQTIGTAPWHGRRGGRAGCPPSRGPSLRRRSRRSGIRRRLPPRAATAA